MRAIEEKMVAAIKQHKNLSGKNTRVVIDKENGEAKVFLFDNLIAVLDGCNRLTIGNCGWQTSTTRSRLNALLQGLDYRQFIYQKKHEWYLCHGGGTNNDVKKLDGEFVETL